MQPHRSSYPKSQGYFCSFKFLQDFFERVKNEVDRKEHWSGAGEYVRYLAKLRNNPSLSLYYADSVAYETSDQLVRLGLLREDQGWQRIRVGDNPRKLRVV